MGGLERAARKEIVHRQEPLRGFTSAGLPSFPAFRAQVKVLNRRYLCAVIPKPPSSGAGDCLYNYTIPPRHPGAVGLTPITCEVRRFQPGVIR